MNDVNVVVKVFNQIGKKVLTNRTEPSHTHDGHLSNQVSIHCSSSIPVDEWEWGVLHSATGISSTTVSVRMHACIHSDRCRLEE